MKNCSIKPYQVITLSILFFSSSCTHDCVERTWYKNADGDHQGNPAISQVSCFRPDGYIDNNLDPDDTNDKITSDCPQVTYYLDSDGDGLGNKEIFVVQCAATPIPSGYVSNHLDCNDDNKEDNLDETTVYLDADGDQYGDTTKPLSSTTCHVPEGYVINNTDCDDTNPLINPGITYTVYEDADNDGLGNPESSLELTSCEPVPENYVLDNTDCNDNAGPFIAAEWSGDYFATRIQYHTNGTSGQTSFSCTIETVDGEPLQLKLIGFWSAGHPNDTLILTIDPCSQKATWDQHAAVGFHPFDPYMGDIIWERIDFGGFTNNEVILDPDDGYGWCTLDHPNKTINLYGVSRIPFHNFTFGHYHVEMEPIE